jgi:hypothetical protein
MKLRLQMQPPEKVRCRENWHREPISDESTIGTDLPPSRRVLAVTPEEIGSDRKPCTVSGNQAATLGGLRALGHAPDCQAHVTCGLTTSSAGKG